MTREGGRSALRTMLLLRDLVTRIPDDPKALRKTTNSETVSSKDPRTLILYRLQTIGPDRLHTWKSTSASEPTTLRTAEYQASSPGTDEVRPKLRPCVTQTKVA